MKICYIIDSMHNGAGRERVVSNKANYLTRMGHDVTIITTDQRGRDYYFPLDAEVKTIDWDIRYTDYVGQNILQKSIAFIKKQRVFNARLQQYLREQKTDILVTLMDRYIPAIVSHNTKCGCIYEHHFNRYAMDLVREKKTRNGLQHIGYLLKDWYFLHRYYKRLDAVVVLTEEDKRYWGKELQQIVCIPNSIDCSTPYRADTGSHTIVSVGRLTFQKGYDRLISAWKKIEQLYGSWQLNIYGDGEDREALQEQIDQAGLIHIHLLPATSEIQQSMQQASIYVLPSRFEGLAMVTLEAMAIGLPIVAFDCPCGPKDIIKHGQNGLLVANGDTQALAQSMAQLMQQDALRQTMGEHARQSAKHFSHERIMQEWVDLFNKIKKV